MKIRVRWIVAGLLFAGGMINYLDRSALSVVAPLISQDMGLRPGQLGIVFSSFFVGYSIFSFVGGAAADRFGSRRVLGVSMTLWSIFCALTAAAASIPALLTCRLLFGAAEGPFASNVNKTVGRWFPQAERATALGIGNAGTPLGGAVAGPIVGLLALTFGWRLSFVIIGAFGLVWVIAWLAVVTDGPEQNRFVAADEREVILTTRDNTTVGRNRHSIGHYLRQPAVIATICAFFSYTYLLYFFLSWFPSYLVNAQHLSMQRMSLVSTIPWALGFLGFLFGGMASDAIARRTGNALLARKIVLVSGLLGAGLCGGLAGAMTGVVPSVTRWPSRCSSCMPPATPIGRSYWRSWNLRAWERSGGRALCGQCFRHHCANYDRLSCGVDRRIHQRIRPGGLHRCLWRIVGGSFRAHKPTTPGNHAHSRLI